MCAIHIQCTEYKKKLVTTKILVGRENVLNLRLETGLPMITHRLVYQGLCSLPGACCEGMGWARDWNTMYCGFKSH